MKENLNEKRVAALKAMDDCLFELGGCGKMYKVCAKALSQLLYVTHKLEDDDFTDVMELAQEFTILLGALEKYEKASRIFDE